MRAFIQNITLFFFTVYAHSLLRFIKLVCAPLRKIVKYLFLTQTTPRFHLSLKIHSSVCMYIMYVCMYSMLYVFMYMYHKIHACMYFMVQFFPLQSRTCEVYHILQKWHKADTNSYSIDCCSSQCRISTMNSSCLQVCPFEVLSYVYSRQPIFGLTIHQLPHNLRS